jgi:hypothetical protein
MTAAGTQGEELKEAHAMFRKLSLAGALVALSVAATGCVVSGSVRTRAYVEPSMVAIEPGVYVVADYDEPVFYTDGYYWLYRDGLWLRSYSYSGGWVRSYSVPYGVRHINRPYAYRHYRARGNARVIRAPVRDHRSNYSRPGRTYSRPDSRNRVERRDVRDNRDHRARPAPAPRDHRAPDKSRDRRKNHDDDDHDRDHRRR